MRMEMVQDASMTAKSTAADGAVTTTLRFTRIRGSMTMAGKTTSYDSDEPSDDPAAAGATALAGKEVEIVFAPDGTIRDVHGFGGLADAASAASPGPLAGATASMFSDASMKKLMQQAFATLPSKSVGVGDSWPVEQDMSSMGMPLVTKGTTTVSAIDASSVEMKSDMTVSVAAPSEKAGTAKAETDPMAAMMKGLVVKDGKTTVTTKVSRADGQILRLDSDGRIVMSMQPPGSPKPMEIESTTKVTTERLP
jgi:hypothetical protein